MQLDFICPACENTVTAPPSLEGSTLACPQCKATIKRWPAPKKTTNEKPATTPTPLSLDDEPAPRTQHAAEKWVTTAGQWIKSVEERVERKCGPRYGKDAVKVGYTIGVLLLIVIVGVLCSSIPDRTYTEDQLMDRFRMEPMESVERHFGRAEQISVTPSGEIVLLAYDPGRIKVRTERGVPGSVLFYGLGGRCASIQIR